MEDLTKTQIILLSLLVSFITSIATGIMTVALLSEAPIGVTQTINRVVERTIEKVAPQALNEKIREVTVVVKEDDFVVNALKKTEGGIFRIYSRDGDGKDEFYGIGVVIDQEGSIVTDTTNISNKKKYFIDGPNNSWYLLNTYTLKDGVKFQSLKIENDSTNPLKITPLTLANPDVLNLGQTVILLSGKDRDIITIGLVSSLLTETEKNVVGTESSTTPKTTKRILSIESNVLPQEDVLGSPLFNSKGELVGLRDYSLNYQNRALYYPVNKITN